MPYKIEFEDGSEDNWQLKAVVLPKYVAEKLKDGERHIVRVTNGEWAIDGEKVMESKK